MKTLIELNGVFYTRNDKNILKDINIQVYSNQKIVILGENGSGKTTLLNMLAGDIIPDKGTYSRGIETQLMGVVYDKFNLLPMMKVKELIKFFCVVYSKSYKSILDEYYDMFRLSSIINNQVCSLSMGERSRISILVSLINDPKCLILDEPFSNIDPTMQSTLYDVIFTHSRAIVYTTHNWSYDSVKEGTLIYTMHAGQLKKLREDLYNLLLHTRSNKKIVCHSHNLHDFNVDNTDFEFFEKDELTYIYGDPSLILDNIKTAKYDIEEIEMKDLYYLNNKH